MQPLGHKELESHLVKAGFTLVRIGKHAVYKRGTATVAVPRHSYITTGTFHQICKKAGLKLERV
jgi:predicted RNA binding protein YcfA (HicA-like mRNA interferase family)